jgi:hypothetical protein
MTVAQVFQLYLLEETYDLLDRSTDEQDLYHPFLRFRAADAAIAFAERKT